MTLKVIRLIDSKLPRKWNPDQILGWLRQAKDTLISYKTVFKIFGVTSILKVSYINTCDVKQNAISLAVSAMQGEATSKTESVLMNDQP